MGNPFNDQDLPVRLGANRKYDVQAGADPQAYKKGILDGRYWRLAITETR